MSVLKDESDMMKRLMMQSRGESRPEPLVISRGRQDIDYLPLAVDYEMHPKRALDVCWRRVGRNKPTENPEQCGLARAGQAHNGDDLSGRKLEFLDADASAALEF